MKKANEDVATHILYTIDKICESCIHKGEGIDNGCAQPCRHSFDGKGMTNECSFKAKKAARSGNSKATQVKN